VPCEISTLALILNLAIDPLVPQILFLVGGYILFTLNHKFVVHL
jgi:hypothetical protein